MSLFSSFPGAQAHPNRGRAAVLAGLLAAAACSAAAQAPPTLGTALQAAWQLSASQRSLSHRQDELAARQRAAGAWLSGAPSVTLSQRSDRFNHNGGLREYEAGVALPLWSPGVRAATAHQVGADQAALQAEPLALKLKLAGELRDIAASTAGAQLELALAERKLAEAKTLLQDTQRRVTSGDSPRIDALQASAAERQAAGQINQARAALAALQAQWRVLTGLAQVVILDDAVAVVDSKAEHPTLVAAQARVNAAQAHLALAEADRRDAPELGLGVTREKAMAGDVAQNALRLSLRIPLGGTNRNAPRLAAARAELDTAHADFDTAQRQVQADGDMARAALQSAQAAAVLANERAAFSAQAQALVAKSYQLGESDLPTRLRADNDRFEAELAAARARADSQRALARLHQALGLLP